MTEKRIIDIRTITDNGPKVDFIAIGEERKVLATRFEIPEVHAFEVHGCFGYQDFITFDGTLSISAERICVATLKPFTEKTTEEIHLLFSENPKDIDNQDEDILLVQKGKIDLFDVFSEEFGLALNPFPKSINTYSDYQDPTDIKQTESPFAVLKNLKKKG